MNMTGERTYRDMNPTARTTEGEFRMADESIALVNAKRRVQAEYGVEVFEQDEEASNKAVFFATWMTVGIVAGMTFFKLFF